MNLISRKTVLSLTCLVAVQGLALYGVLRGADTYTATPEQSCRATNLALSAQVQQLQAEVEQFKKHDLQVELCGSAKLALDNCVIESSKDSVITVHAKESAPAVTAPAKTTAPPLPARNP